METFYLNTDLDLIGYSSLKSLVQELENSCSVLHCDQISEQKWTATLETNQIITENPNDQIREFCQNIETLSNQAKEIWWSLEKREFNAGYNAGNTWGYTSTLTFETIQLLHKYNCSFTITIYPEDK